MKSGPPGHPRALPPDDATDLEGAPGSSKSVDALARSIGHAISVPLAALFASLDIAMESLRDEHRDPRARTTETLMLLTDVRQAAERVHAVVERLRATALPTQPPPPTLSGVMAKAVEIRSKLRVLVVDDDVMVGNALKRCLRDHDVMVLDNARGALATVAAGERFDVLLCDLMMPEMTGMDLHEEILRVAPEQAQRMIFVTGGAVTTRARDFVATVPNPVIDKPFDMKMLRDMIGMRLAGQPR